MARKKPNTIRTTISILRDLKRRMAKVGEDVNWSALACQAFEEKLAAIAIKKEKTVISDVVVRLRASKRASANQDFREGFACGRSWTELSAEAVELERLQSLWDRLQHEQTHGWEWWFNHGDPRSTADELLSEMSAGNEYDAEIFEGVKSNEWLRGFAEGALDVWAQVRDHL